jgi:hypothetical protein
MNRILFACLLLLLVAGTLTAQTVDQSYAGCNLAREKAPAIRGIKLGMTSDEIHAVLPGLREDYKDFVSSARNFPQFGSAFLNTNVVDKDRFNGIEGINFQLFDDHLVQYNVFYRGPNSVPRGPYWPNADDLIARFADAYHLPGPANWVPDAGSKILRCKGFEVHINTSSGAQIMVREPGNPWVAEQKKRREAFEEQLRRDFKP